MPDIFGRGGRLVPPVLSVLLVAAVSGAEVIYNGRPVGMSAPGERRGGISAVFAAAPPADSRGDHLAVVGFGGPIAPEQVESLTRLGAEVHHYVPQYAYLVSASEDELAAISELPEVTGVGALPAPHRIRPSLLATPPDQTVRVVVLSFGSETPDHLAAMGVSPSRVERTIPGWTDSRVETSASRLAEIAAVPGVFHIEPEPVYQRTGERGAQTAAGAFPAAGTSPTGPGYAAWLASHGLTGGAGVVVQVQDDGLDQGIATNAPGTIHEDLRGRVVGIFNATSNPLGDSADGHGMINAGIIAGNAAVGTTDAAGFRLGQGVVPAAGIYATKIFRNNNGPFDLGANTLTSLATDAQNHGARFSNNSWGAPVGGAYTSDSAVFDALTRDCDPGEPGNQPMVYFISAGNSGPGGNTVGSPGTAKNVISVGAGENSDADGVDGCNVPPTGANSIRDLINFSSRGPTDDGRFGVTLFAVGTHVQGPASTHAAYNGLGVCDKYWPPAQADYARSSGTSHSTPIACGAGVLVHEFFNTTLTPLGHSPDPGPAMIRAVLANTATDMAGGNNGAGDVLGPVPNALQGWGSVNLSNLFEFPSRLFSHDEETLFTASGQSAEFQIGVPDPTRPLRITLAWTDTPALPVSNPNLVNNLDLIVTGGGNTYRGNVFSGGMSVTGGAADTLNTIEGVYIANPTESYTVRVVATNIAGNGVPGNATPLDQDFALFITNGSGQSEAGYVDIETAVVNCFDTFDLLVSDSGLRGAGTVMVTLSATSGDSMPLTLTETGSNSGVMRGTVTTSGGAVAPDMLLQVAHGDTITATYNDAETGSGPGVATDMITADCEPPSVLNVRFPSRTTDSITIAFETTEPAVAEAHAGSVCGVTDVSAAGGTAPTLSHEITLNGLTECTIYRFRIEVRDPANNTAWDDNGGACHLTSTRMPTDLFFDDFGAADPGWTSDGYWHRITPAGNCPPAFNPVHAWYYGREDTCLYDDAARNRGELISPLIGLPNAEDLELTFRSWEETEAVSGVDLRRTWIQKGGQRTLVHNAPPVNTLSFVERGPFALDDFAGSDIRVVFEFDTVDGAFNNFAGWYVDDVRIRAAGPCALPLGDVTLDRPLYSCGQTVAITVHDSNAPGGTILVTATTGAGDSEPVMLSSAGHPEYHSGQITLGAAGMGVTPGDGMLQTGLASDEIRVTWEDNDIGNGQPAPVTATAELDCEPPVVTGVSFPMTGPDGFVVNFGTSEPATAEVEAGAGCGSVEATAAGSLNTEHSVEVAGLAACSTYRVRIRVTDEAGNTSIEDNGGICHGVTTGPDGLNTFLDTFEPTAQAGWSHQALIGADRWAQQNSPFAWSPMRVYGYLTGGAGGTADAVLVSPSLDGGGLLRFRHTFQFEPDTGNEFSGFDGGLIEITTNGGADWSDLGPDIISGGYNGLIYTGSGDNPLGENRPAWVRGTFGVMEEVTADLSAYPGTIRVRFRFGADSTIASGGWLIDNFERLDPQTCANGAGEWSLYE